LDIGLIGELKMFIIGLVFFINFSLFGIEKAFLHKDKSLDRFVFYLNQKSSLSTVLLPNGGVRFLLKGGRCDNVGSIKNRVSNEHYSINHTSVGANGVCSIDVVSKQSNTIVGAPQSFRAINGKSAVSVAIKKSKKKALFCGRPMVVIDPGHGGKDSGTVGINGVAEKDVALSVAKKLKQLLEKQGIAVRLTRDKDKFIQLDDRTSLANKDNCALFISLHANSSSRESACGIETYFSEGSLLKQPNDKRDKESKVLALDVHDCLLRATKAEDRKVRKEVSQVLLGTLHPSILVELGFMSNRQEAKKLSNSRYQNKLAEGLAKGIAKYLAIPV
jgi:N-acetylmuramoyl-L-alanine amidase